VNLQLEQLEKDLERQMSNSLIDEASKTKTFQRTGNSKSTVRLDTTYNKTNKIDVQLLPVSLIRF
jgi:hypothetical protein